MHSLFEIFTQAILAGFLDKTNIVDLIRHADDDEALIKIQQMHGFVTANIANADIRDAHPIDGRAVLKEHREIEANETSSTTKSKINVVEESKDGNKCVAREIFARVGSALFGCIPPGSRTNQESLKNVLTIKAQIREM